TDADKITPIVPEKTKVNDIANLTEDEKAAVKKAVEDANRGNFPAGTTVTVGQDGTATITYPNNSKDTIAGTDLVEAKTDADKITPIVPEKTKVNDIANLTEDEKAAVKKAVEDANRGNFPAGTTVTVGQDGTATITYPNNSKDTIAGTDLVEAKTDADKITPIVPEKTKVNDIANLTEDEKSAVKKAVEDANKDNFPAGTKVTVGKDGTATITYPDNSKDTIAGTDLVEAKAQTETDADKYNPQAPDNKIPVDDKNNLTDEEKDQVKDAIKDKNPELPNGTEITVDANGDTTITYPDNSTDTIAGTDLVEEKADVNDNPVDPRPTEPTKPTKPAKPQDPEQPGSEVEKPDTDRIFGQDRIETAIKVSKQKFGQAETVIIARHDVFADALVAGPLAYALDAPILLSRPNELPNNVLAEIERLGAKNIIIVGGLASIDENVDRALREIDNDLERLEGPTRYETAVAVAKKLKEVNGGNNTAVIATGVTYPDALAVGPFAAVEGMPILLVKPNELPTVVGDAFEELGIEKTYIAGGEASVGEELETQMPSLIRRFSGNDRYETAVEIAKATMPNAKHIYMASGEVFADALVAGPAAAKENAPILLNRRNEAPQVLVEYINGLNLNKITVVGGDNTITQESIESLFK
ncbi:MAG: cell wall-binding repeat-containing protein, partial [Tissierellia bacterium]|nr:cell wall-binding repeat-containing protein [Tissierellia bacterium]